MSLIANYSNSAFARRIQVELNRKFNLHNIITTSFADLDNAWQVSRFAPKYRILINSLMKRLQTADQAGSDWNSWFQVPSQLREGVTLESCLTVPRSHSENYGCPISTIMLGQYQPVCVDIFNRVESAHNTLAAGMSRYSRSNHDSRSTARTAYWSYGENDFAIVNNLKTSNHITYAMMLPFIKKMVRNSCYVQDQSTGFFVNTPYELSESTTNIFRDDSTNNFYFDTPIPSIDRSHDPSPAIVFKLLNFTINKNKSSHLLGSSTFNLVCHIFLHCPHLLYPDFESIQHRYSPWAQIADFYNAIPEHNSTPIFSYRMSVFLNLFYMLASLTRLMTRDGGVPRTCDQIHFITSKTTRRSAIFFGGTMERCRQSVNNFGRRVAACIDSTPGHNSHNYGFGANSAPVAMTSAPLLSGSVYQHFQTTEDDLVAKTNQMLNENIAVLNASGCALSSIRLRSHTIHETPSHIIPSTLLDFVTRSTAICEGRRNTLARVLEIFNHSGDIACVLEPVTPPIPPDSFPFHVPRPERPSQSPPDDVPEPWSGVDWSLAIAADPISTSSTTQTQGESVPNLLDSNDPISKLLRINNQFNDHIKEHGGYSLLIPDTHYDLFQQLAQLKPVLKLNEFGNVQLNPARVPELGNYYITGNSQIPDIVSCRYLGSINLSSTDRIVKVPYSEYLGFNSRTFCLNKIGTILENRILSNDPSLDSEYSQTIDADTTIGSMPRIRENRFADSVIYVNPLAATTTLNRHATAVSSSEKEYMLLCVHPTTLFMRSLIGRVELQYNMTAVLCVWSNIAGRSNLERKYTPFKVVLRFRLTPFIKSRFMTGHYGSNLMLRTKIAKMSLPLIPEVISHATKEMEIAGSCQIQPTEVVELPSTSTGANQNTSPTPETEVPSRRIDTEFLVQNLMAMAESMPVRVRERVTVATSAPSIVTVNGVTVGELSENVVQAPEGSISPERLRELGLPYNTRIVRAGG